MSWSVIAQHPISQIVPRSFHSLKEAKMKKQITKTILIAITLLTILSTAVLPQAAQASNFPTQGCWCTDYVARAFGGLTGYPVAWQWNDYLKRLGWVEVSPEIGSVAVMDTNFPGADSIAGHVGIVEAYSNGKITLRQNHNKNIGMTGDSTEYGCTNITNMPWATSVIGNSHIRFWKPQGPTPIPSPIVSPTPIPTTFKNGSSSLTQDQSWGRANLKVCADNLNGNTVNVLFNRAGRSWTYSQKATSSCVTFWDMDGAGPLNLHTTYYSRAALNQSPDPTWSIPCFTATGGKGLCDQITRP